MPMKKPTQTQVDILLLTKHNNYEINKLLSDFDEDTNTFQLINNLLSIKYYTNEILFQLTEIACTFKNESNFDILLDKVLELQFEKRKKSITPFIINYFNCLANVIEFTKQKNKIFLKFHAALTDSSLTYLHKLLIKPFLGILNHFKNEFNLLDINLELLVDYLPFSKEIAAQLVDSPLISNFLLRNNDKYFLRWALQYNLSFLRLLKKCDLIVFLFFNFDLSFFKKLGLLNLQHFYSQNLINEIENRLGKQEFITFVEKELEIEKEFTSKLNLDSKNEESKIEENTSKYSENTLKDSENPLKYSESSLKSEENTSKYSENPLKSEENPFKEEENTSKYSDNPFKEEGEKPQKEISVHCDKSQLNSCEFCNLNENSKYLIALENNKNNQLKELDLELATFLRFSHETDLKNLGDFLCKEKNLKYFLVFLESFNFSNLQPLNALRILLESFIISGESQAIYRVIEHFNEKYCLENEISKFFASELLKEEMINNMFVFFYAIIALNTSLHNKVSVIKPTQISFIESLKKEKLEKELIIEVFEEIKQKPFVYKTNNSFSLENYELFCKISVNKQFSYNICNNCFIKCYKTLIREFYICDSSYFKLCALLNETKLLKNALIDFSMNPQLDSLNYFFKYFFIVLDSFDKEIPTDIYDFIILPFNIFYYISNNSKFVYLIKRKRDFDPLYNSFITSTLKIKDPIFIKFTQLELEEQFYLEMLEDILIANIERIDLCKIVNKKLILQASKRNLKDQFYHLIGLKLDPIFLLELAQHNSAIFDIERIFPLLNDNLDCYKLIVYLSKEDLFKNLIRINFEEVQFKNLKKRVHDKREETFLTYSYVERFKKMLSIPQNTIHMLINSSVCTNLKNPNLNEQNSLIYLILKSDNQKELKDYLAKLIKKIDVKKFLKDHFGILFMIKDKEILTMLIEVFKEDKDENVWLKMKDYEIVEDVSVLEGDVHEI